MTNNAFRSTVLASLTKYKPNRGVFEDSKSIVYPNGFMVDYGR
jgi:hypothetical protein